MKIDMTLSEACYVRSMVQDRVSYLESRIKKYDSLYARGGDRLSLEERKACAIAELGDLRSVYGELTRVISNMALYGRLLDEFGLDDRKLIE